MNRKCLVGGLRQALQNIPTRADSNIHTHSHTHIHMHTFSPSSPSLATELTLPNGYHYFTVNGFLSLSFSCLLALTIFYLPFLASEAATGTRQAGGGVEQVEDLS